MAGVIDRERTTINTGAIIFKMWIMNPRMSFIQTGLQFKSSCDSVLTEKPIRSHKTVFIISSQTGVNEHAMSVIL